MGEKIPQLDILNHSIKPLVPWMSSILLSHQPKVSYRIPQTSQAFVEVLSCSPQPDGEVLLTKTTLFMPLNTEKLHPYWPASRLLDGTLHTTAGERSSPVSPSYKPCERHQPAWKTHCCNSGMNDMGETTLFFFLKLDLRPAFWDETPFWHCLEEKTYYYYFAKRNDS